MARTRSLSSHCRGGKLQRELEQLIDSLGLGEHVYLAGAIPHQELYFWYSAADLFCLASSREGWPNVVLEALASGTPVVATDIWGIPEIICSDKLGILTKRSERTWHRGDCCRSTEIMAIRCYCPIR